MYIIDDLRLTKIQRRRTDDTTQCQFTIPKKMWCMFLYVKNQIATTIYLCIYIPSRSSSAQPKLLKLGYFSVFTRVLTYCVFQILKILKSSWGFRQPSNILLSLLPIQFFYTKKVEPKRISKRRMRQAKSKSQLKLNFFYNCLLSPQARFSPFNLV